MSTMNNDKMGNKQVHLSADSQIHTCVYIMLNINLWANYVASKRLELLFQY